MPLFWRTNQQIGMIEATNSRTRRRGRTRKRTTTTMANANPLNMTMANANRANTKMANANSQKTTMANANRPYVPLSSSLSSTIFKSCSSSTIFAIFVVNIVQQQMSSRGVEAVRCYCTDEQCVPYGVCEAAVCLVGLLRANNAVIRTCGNEALGCRRNVDRWSHICSCDQHFCNTFHFLRANTNIDGTGSIGAAPENGRGSSNTMPMMEQNQYQHQQQQMSSNGEEDRRVFERIDQAPDDFAIFDHQMTDNDAEQHERTIKNSQLLTLLLVIVPLSVGAAAVVVVSINSYCHLC